MDYDQLISLARSKAQHAESVIKKSKPKTAGPDPKAIESFLIKKRLNEIKKEEEERAKREKLLYLRSQNSKSSKKAKLMSSRTKDNDYSKINLSERDIQNKERVDSQLRSKQISNKLDRMKQRIELEQKEEDQPRKRKRKEHSNYAERLDDVNYNYNYDRMKKEREELFKRPSTDQPAKPAKAAGKQPPSYEELLKMATQQKEKKTLQEEIEEEISSKHKVIDRDDLKRRAELYQKSLTSKRKSTLSSKSAINSDSYDNGKDHSIAKSNSSTNKSNYPLTSLKDKYDRLDSKLDHNRFKDKPIPKLSTKSNQNNQESKIESILSSKSGKLASKIASLSKEELLELSNAVKKAERRKSVSKDEEYSPRPVDEYKPKPIYKSTNEPTYIPTKIKQNLNKDEEYDPISNYKTNRSSNEQFKAKPSSQVKQPAGKLFDIDSLTPEEIEKIRRERLEKQKREEAKSSSMQKQLPKPIKNDKYAQSRPPISKSRPQNNGYLPPIGTNYVRGLYDSSYCDDQNEDDYEDEEDDDMQDFIDDGDDCNGNGIPSSIRDEIDKIFKYKRNKYQDFDDDDIEEASYAQQMMEERRSSRIGYLEDLEEERKEEMERRKKAKLKKKGYRISSDEDD